MKASAPATLRTASPNPARLRCITLVAALILAGGLRASNSFCAPFDPSTLDASKSMQAKLQVLGSKDPRPLPSYPAVIVTEHEFDSYMIVHSKEFLPAGVGAPAIKVQPDHVAISGDVNFDDLSRLYPNQTDMGPKILAAMFRGTQHVTITGTVNSQPAGVLVQVESIVVGSTTVPKWLVDYLIQNVLQPKYHFDLSKPFPYTDHVKRVVLGSGQITFLRGPK